MYVVEGERDVETVERLGRTATCNSGGAGKWKPEYSAYLKGKYVVVIPDDDEPGRRHAETVAQSVHAAGAQWVKVVALPEAKDVTEWVEAGGTKKQLIAIVKSAPNYQPPPKAELEAAAHPGEKKRESQANQLIKLASGDEVELFHSPDGDGYASVAANGHRENWQVRSRGFKDWLLYKFLQGHGKGASSQALNDALNTIAATAKYVGVEHQIFTRIGELDDSIYLDLGNKDWQAVSINKQGWQVVDDPPIRFARRRGMLPLPIPERRYNPASLREFVNVGATRIGFYS